MSDSLKYCPLCGSTDIRELFCACDPHYCIPGSFQLSRCGACSLAFVNPMPSDEELKALYPADYYAYQEEFRAGRFKARMKKWLGYWQGTREPKFCIPGTMLDIGCGAGSFLESMRNKGWSVYGVEINEKAVQLAQSKGLNVIKGSLTAGSFPAETFDYIRASHSFEHMARPHEILNEIYRLLKPGARLLVAVPNFESLTARVFGQHWYHLCPPVHVFHYSNQTLPQILTMHNFDVTGVAFNSHYAGVLGSVQIWFNRGTSRKSFEGALFNTRSLRVLSGWMEKATDLLRLGDMIEVIARKA